jgi:hypothetical protein
MSKQETAIDTQHTIHFHLYMLLMFILYLIAAAYRNIIYLYAPTCKNKINKLLYIIM